MAGRRTQSDLIMELIQESARSRQALEDTQTVLKENSGDIKYIKSRMEKTYHTVYGNGQAGLVEKIENQSKELQNLTCLVNQVKGGSRVISFVWGGIVGVIGFLIGAIK